MTNFAHEVYRPSRNDRRGVHVDTVFANYNDPEEMRRALINHDGYPTDIFVRCNGKTSERK